MRTSKIFGGVVALSLSVLSLPSQAWVMSIDRFGVVDNIGNPTSAPNVRVLDHFNPPSGAYAGGATRGVPVHVPGSSRITMDTAQGSVGLSSVTGNLRSLSRVRMAGALGMGTSFLVGGVFDLVNQDPRGAYGIRLNDAGSLLPNDMVDVAVRKTSGGQLQVLFRNDTNRNVAADGFDAVEAVDINPTASQIALFMLYDAASGQIGAGFFEMAEGDTDFINATNINSVIAGTTPIPGVTPTLFTSTYTMFHGEDFAKAEFFATQPVPEPSTWLMMLAGIGLLTFMRKRSA